MCPDVVVLPGNSLKPGILRTMQHLQNGDGEDPLKRVVEKQTDQEELSPMDPPEAYEPPNLEAVPYEEMHPFLQKLRDEHKSILRNWMLLKKPCSRFSRMEWIEDSKEN